MHRATPPPADQVLKSKRAKAKFKANHHWDSKNIVNGFEGTGSSHIYRAIQSPTTQGSEVPKVKHPKLFDFTLAKTGSSASTHGPYLLAPALQEANPKVRNILRPREMSTAKGKRIDAPYEMPRDGVIWLLVYFKAGLANSEFVTNLSVSPLAANFCPMSGLAGARLSQ
ncbi:predicted protein [Histoplasma capsulatum var. duboisii H88]|uniref:Predicted protein n=1 Tax=Ajellomyces capsulatus (strain H88) TaxID=544711 RepID=F0UNB1_AJEC8|nr:predicted protein [Histoplasma capsulatum var. duboisii H88]